MLRPSRNEAGAWRRCRADPQRMYRTWPLKSRLGRSAGATGAPGRSEDRHAARHAGKQSSSGRRKAAGTPSAPGCPIACNGTRRPLRGATASLRATARCSCTTSRVKVLSAPPRRPCTLSGSSHCSIAHGFHTAIELGQNFCRKHHLIQSSQRLEHRGSLLCMHIAHAQP